MSTQSTSGGPLVKIAADMKRSAAAAKHGHAYRKLAHSLSVVYGQRADQWRLAIGRQAPTQPSTQELEIVANAFGAPFDFEPIHRQSKWWDPLDDRAYTFNVLEITWREVETAPTAKEEIGYAH